MARCKHYVEAFDCCAKTSEFIEDVLWVKSCYYKDDVCPNCRCFEEKEDVVPVIRCKDCKHKETLTDLTNKKISTVCLLGEALHFVEDNHYCSYGERRGSG